MRLSVDGAEVEAEVAGDALVVRHAGREWRFHAEPLGAGRVRLRGEGLDRVVWVSGTKVGTAGDVAKVERVLTRRGAAGGGLRAPMPATVVRVLVEVGASVEAGTPLVVLSAMKTEVVVRAPHAGTVAGVRAKAGETVEAGGVVVELARAAEGR